MYKENVPQEKLNIEKPEDKTADTAELSEESLKPEKKFVNPFYFSFKGFLLGLAAAIAAFLLCSKKTDLALYQYALISAGFLLCGMLRIKKESKVSTAITWLLFLLTPLLFFYLVESLNENNIYNDLTVAQGVLNMVWYSLFLFMFYVIFRRKSIAVGVFSLFCLFIGLANHYVLKFRGTVIFPCDVFSVSTAANVIDNFNFSPDELVVYALVISTLFVFGFFCLTNGFKKDKTKKIVVMPLMTICLVYVFVFFNTGMLKALDVYAQQWKTQANGFVLNFTAALRYSHVEKPEGYTAETVKNTADEITAETFEGEKPVNIIAVMNESFADFSIFEDFECSEDPLAFYHSLKENTIKGTVAVSVTGGGTANSEFEFLTGNSLAFLPQGTVAYQLYFDENTPSVVDQMKANGYSSVAFHPYIASGWNRPLVYEWMGFDKQVFRDDMSQKKILRRYVSDSSDYAEIYSMTDNSEDPMFIFNVTMQNHSGYSVTWKNVETPVSVTGKFANKEYSAAVNQYLSLLKASDNALKELVEHYSNSDEPTMIVFFGDHQPPLSNNFYKDLYGKELDSRTAEETMMQYKVPFFIWANYDIKEQEGVDISLNYLMALALKTGNIDYTKYQTYLTELQSELPLVNRVGFKTAAGEYYVAKDENKLNEEQKDMLKEYEYIQYNNLFDNKNMPYGFFSYHDTD